jgi:hypothetical protein
MSGKAGIPGGAGGYRPARRSPISSRSGDAPPHAAAQHVRVPMKRSITMLLVAAGLTLAACGDSEEETPATTSSGNSATTQVCAARADIRKQVDELKGMTLSAASIPSVTTNLQAIRNDLRTIKNAQGDLSGARKEEVQTATADFEAQVAAAAKDVVSGGTITNAKAELQAAVTKVSDGFDQTLGRVDCG